MKKSLLLKRYSDSLFQVSLKKKKLENVYQNLLYIQQICNKEPQIIQIFNNPLVNSKSKMKILSSLTNNDDKSIAYHFFLILLHNRRENLICEIINQFLKDYLEYKKIKNGTLIISQEVSEKVIDNIKKVACKLLNCHEIILKQIIDPTILGGFIVKIESFYLDASLKSKFEDLSKKLKKKFKLN